MESVSRKDYYDTRDKIKKKPTLYFNQPELDTLDEMQKEGTHWKRSLATTIENAVREAIVAFRKKKAKEQEKAEKELEAAKKKKRKK